MSKKTLARCRKELKKLRPPTVLLHGNTFTVKEQLKELGAFWDQANKAWCIDKRKEAKALKLIDSAPEPPYRYKGLYDDAYWEGLHDIGERPDWSYDESYGLGGFNEYWK